jgi:hypothetical protein
MKTDISVSFLGIELACRRSGPVAVPAKSQAKAGIVRNVSCVLIALLALFQAIAVPDLWASPQSEKDAQRAAGIKAKADALGLGTEVNVVMLDGTNKRGRIEEISEQAFQLNTKGISEKLQFSQVKKIERHKPIWARKALWAAIAAGVVFAILAITKPLKD